MVFITRDAVTYLHFINGINILSYVVICVMSVESPLYLLSKDKNQDAIRNLNYIARVNSMFSKNNLYIFHANIKIFGSSKELELYNQKSLMTDQEEEAEVSQSFWQVTKYIFKVYLKLYLLFAFIVSFLFLAYNINVYYI
jgi:hypothetical protein